jgi:hypothetical protein
MWWVSRAGNNDMASLVPNSDYISDAVTRVYAKVVVVVVAVTTIAMVDNDDDW